MSDNLRLTAARLAEIEALLRETRITNEYVWMAKAEVAIRELLAEQWRREAQIAWVLARIGQIPAYLQPEGVVEAVAVLRGTADAILRADVDV